MLSKLISFFLILVTITVHANASAHNGIKAAFDELHYALSVDWDQKDPDFYNTQSEKFRQELKKLQDQGVSQQEILNILLSEVQDKKLVRDIETTFSLISINALQPDEAEAQIKNLIDRTYKKGASWSGSSVILGMALTVAIVAVVVLIYKDELMKEGEKCYMAWKCHDVCTLTGCKEVCGEECI